MYIAVLLICITNMMHIYIYIHIDLLCLWRNSCALVHCHVELETQTPEPWPIQIYTAFTPTKLPKVLSEAAEILDEDIAQRCTSRQMIGSDGNHVVQVQSVKEIRLDEIDMTLKCTLEVGLGMKLSSPGGCFQKKVAMSQAVMSCSDWIS